MAVVEITATPWISEGFVSFVLNHHEDHADQNGTLTGADAVQLRCALQNLDGDSDPDTVDIDTACDPNGQRYGQPSTQYNLSLRYSPQLYAAIEPFELSDVSFATINNYNLPVAALNKESSGVVRFGQLPPEEHYLNNENRVIELELFVVGGRATRTDLPAAAVFTHPAGPALP